MGNIVRLTQAESVRLDQDRLSALFAQLGETGAENVVCRAMEELALRLGGTERLYRRGATAEMRKNARLLAAIAEQIGMTLLARVAGDVVQSADIGDEVALAATIARLRRIGEGSLTAIWDMHDPPA